MVFRIFLYGTFSFYKACDFILKGDFDTGVSGEFCEHILYRTTPVEGFCRSTESAKNLYVAYYVMLECEKYSTEIRKPQDTFLVNLGPICKNVNETESILSHIKVYCSSHENKFVR